MLVKGLKNNKYSYPRSNSKKHWILKTFQQNFQYNWRNLTLKVLVFNFHSNVEALRVTLYGAFYIHKLFQAINSIDWHYIQTNLLTHLYENISFSKFRCHLMRLCVSLNICNCMNYVCVTSLPPGWVDDIICYPGNIQDVVWTKAKV